MCCRVYDEGAIAGAFVDLFGGSFSRIDVAANARGVCRLCAGAMEAERRYVCMFEGEMQTEGGKGLMRDDEVLGAGESRRVGSCFGPASRRLRRINAVLGLASATRGALNGIQEMHLLNPISIFVYSISILDLRVYI